MIKRVKRDLVVLLAAIVISMLINLNVQNNFINTLYTVSSVMFSIGMGILVTFNLNSAKNAKLIKTIEANLDATRNTYIFYFLVSTVSFLLENYLSQVKRNVVLIYQSEEFTLSINFSVAACILILYTVLYFVINFLEVQKLNRDVFKNSLDAEKPKPTSHQ